MKYLHFLPKEFMFCLLFAGSLSAQSKIQYEYYTLPNGLGVILHEDHSVPIVAVSVMYHVGSKNEDPSRTGFAHFFEHLLFEGSENIQRGEYDKYVEGAGGMLNANTNYDRTYYYEVLPSHQLELGLWLESERLLHAKVEDKGIETQRQVVKEERRLRIENQPYGTVVEELMKRMYKEHPYQWPVIGSMAHLDAAEEKDYVNFYKTFYVPNNAILSIAGDFTSAQAKEWINKYFGSIPKGTRPIPRPTIVEPPLTKEVRDAVPDNIQLPAVILGYRIPAQGTPDFYAVDVLSHILSAGASSRLYKTCVDEHQEAVYVGSFPFNLEHPGVLIAFGIANAGVATEALEARMNAEVDKLKTELISDQELEKVQNQIENEFTGSYKTMAGRAEALANYQMYLGDANLINTELERYRKVTKEDIRNAAIKYFDKNKRVTLMYVPKNNKP